MLNQLLGFPVLLFLVLLPLCMAAAAGLRIAGPGNFLNTPLQLAAFGLLSAAVLGHLYFAAYYLGTPNFTDHIEPNTASVAWLYANGGQLFHPVDAAERYAFLYGPLAYIATALSYTLFGASTFTAKLAGFGCLLLAMTTLVWATRRRFPQHWYPAVIALGYFSLLALFFKNHSFWSKPDPFMILGVCISLLACLSTNKTRAWIIFGVAAGLVVNAKITGVLYLLPFAAWLFERDGIRAWLVAAVPALTLAVLPFLFPASASLPNYIAWLQSAGGHGISRVLLVQNFLFILFASIPVIAFLLWQFMHNRSASLLLKHKLVVVASLASVVLVLIAASKPGSGPHHFLPFLPVLGFLTASAVVTVQTEQGSSSTAFIFWSPLASVLLAAAVKTAFALYYGLLVIGSQFSADALLTDLTELSSQYPERNLYMGYGDGSSYTRTFVRNNLVYMGNPYLLDSAAIMDFQFSGVDIPPATTAYMLNDPRAVWLIPAGQEPFTLGNWYYRNTGRKLFDAAFRQAFAQGFTLEASTAYFDIYVPGELRQEQSSE